jgi:hypothetical protein
MKNKKSTNFFSKADVTIYEHALINIMFHYGKCWNGARKCYDPQEVAWRALRKANPELYRCLNENEITYRNITVFKNGRVKVC